MLEGERLYKAKDSLRKQWEDIFNTKIEEHLSEEGLKTFWSNDTNYDDAGDMLTAAAFLMFVSEAEKEGLVEVVVLGEGGVDEIPVEDIEPYEVERITDRFFYPSKFKTVEEAKAFIEKEAMTTKFTVKDFRVVKVVC